MHMVVLFECTSGSLLTWKTTDREKRIEIAYNALKLMPYCADAFNLLAAESKNRRDCGYKKKRR